MEAKMGTWAMRRWNRKSTFFLLVLIGAAIFVHSNFRVSYWWKLIVDRHLPRFLFRFPAPGLTTTTNKTSGGASLLLNNSGCVIPAFDAWDSSLQPFVDKEAEGQICHLGANYVKVIIRSY